MLRTAQPYTLHIKNMVCPRCIKVVMEELERLHLPVLEVSLGEVHLKEKPSDSDFLNIKSALFVNGFELLEDKKSEAVEQIRLAIINLIYSGEVENLQVNLSEYLAKTLDKDYSYLSGLFSAEEGITIARYVVLQKVERSKELLTYNELTLSQVAYQLGYSSVAHLSNQFKQVTGVTPSEYKKAALHPRKSLDKVV